MAGVSRGRPSNRCKVYNSTAQSIPDQAFTAVTFDSEVYDTGLHSTSSNTSRITITQAGTYVFTAQLQYDATALGTFVLAGIYKNGTPGTSGFPLCIDRQGATSFQPHTLAVVDSVAAGDYVQVFVYHDRGSSVSLKAPTLTITNGVVSASSETAFLPAMFSAEQLS